MMAIYEKDSFEALQDSSDQSEGVFLSDDPPLFKLKSPKIFKEIFRIIINSIPLSSCFVLSYFPNVLNLYFISKNDDLMEICAIGSILILLNISGFHFLSSLNTEIGKAIEKLNDQPNFSFRAPYNKYTTGLYFHRGFVLGTIFMIPWFIFLCLFKSIGFFFEFNADFLNKIGYYLIFLLPSIYFNFAFDLTRNLLTSLNVLYIPCSFLVLTVFLHYLFCLLFQMERNFELNAASFCKNITDFLNTFLIMLYAWNLKPLNKIWIPWTSNSFKNLISHLNFFNLFENWIEFLSYELMNFAIFFIANIKELSPYLIITCIQSMNFAINLGFAKALKILIRNSIKEGAINRAKNITILGFLLTFLLASGQWLCFFLLKSIVMNVMLKEDLVKKNFDDYSDYYVYKIFLDVWLITGVSNLKALNKYRLSFQLHILCFYFGGFGLICYFDGLREWGVNGLWIAYMMSQLGMICITVVYLGLIVNWKNEINRICINKLKKNLNTT